MWVTQFYFSMYARVKWKEQIFVEQTLTKHIKWFYGIRKEFFAITRWKIHTIDDILMQMSFFHANGLHNYTSSLKWHVSCANIEFTLAAFLSAGNLQKIIHYLVFCIVISWCELVFFHVKIFYCKIGCKKKLESSLTPKLNEWEL